MEPGFNWMRLSQTNRQYVFCSQEWGTKEQGSSDFILCSNIDPVTYASTFNDLFDYFGTTTIWGFHISHEEIVYHERLIECPIQRQFQMDEVIERSKARQLEILWTVLVLRITS